MVQETLFQKEKPFNAVKNERMKKTARAKLVAEFHLNKLKKMFCEEKRS